MSTTNDDGQQPDEMESPKQEASACCGPGCGCESAAKPGKGRWVIGVIVLAAAGVMVVRGMVKSHKGPAADEKAGFVNPAATASAGGGAESMPDAGAGAVGTTLEAFSELNRAATNTDAVFVFLPAREGTTANVPSAPMKAAARTIEAKGVKCGLFTLKAGCADYEQLAKQVSVPGVLALVKGRGMSAVTGEVTEAKLLQGYVGACSASGCGPGASAGCCPK